jgi:hypothetical protein
MDLTRSAFVESGATSQDDDEARHPPTEKHRQARAKDAHHTLSNSSHRLQEEMWWITGSTQLLQKETIARLRADSDLDEAFLLRAGFSPLGQLHISRHLLQKGQMTHSIVHLLLNSLLTLDPDAVQSLINHDRLHALQPQVNRNDITPLWHIVQNTILKEIEDTYAISTQMQHLCQQWFLQNAAKAHHQQNANHFSYYALDRLFGHYNTPQTQRIIANKLRILNARLCHSLIWGYQESEIRDGWQLIQLYHAAQRLSQPDANPAQLPQTIQTAYATLQRTLAAPQIAPLLPENLIPANKLDEKTDTEANTETSPSLPQKIQAKSLSVRDLQSHAALDDLINTLYWCGRAFTETAVNAADIHIENGWQQAIKGFIWWREQRKLLPPSLQMAADVLLIDFAYFLYYADPSNQGSHTYALLTQFKRHDTSTASTYDCYINDILASLPNTTTTRSIYKQYIFHTLARTIHQQVLTAPKATAPGMIATTAAHTPTGDVITATSAQKTKQRRLKKWHVVAVAAAYIFVCIVVGSLQYQDAFIYPDYTKFYATNGKCDYNVVHKVQLDDMSFSDLKRIAPRNTAASAKAPVDLSLVEMRYCAFTNFQLRYLKGAQADIKPTVNLQSLEADFNLRCRHVRSTKPLTMQVMKERNTYAAELLAEAQNSYLNGQATQMNHRHPMLKACAPSPLAYMFGPIFNPTKLF